MNESTYHVNPAHKAKAGEYYALTYSRDANVYSPTGTFRFRKVGTKWSVSHADFTDPRTPNERTYDRLQPTLKAAKEFAEQIVRDLPANVAHRREAALRGARPFSVVGYGTSGVE